MRVDVSELSEQPSGGTAAPRVEFMPVFSGESFLRALTYPVIVEAWKKKNSGRGKRAWLAEFTETERDLICKWHAKFHDWHSVSGTPDRVAMKLTTLELLQRAVDFFL